MEGCTTGLVTGKQQDSDATAPILESVLMHSHIKRGGGVTGWTVEVTVWTVEVTGWGVGVTGAQHDSSKLVSGFLLTQSHIGLAIGNALVLIIVVNHTKIIKTLK